MKDRMWKIRKPVSVTRFRWERREERKVSYVRLHNKSVLVRNKCSTLEQTPRFAQQGGGGDYAVMTPTTIAANAPRALKTFLDPPLLLLLLLLAEFEGLEPPEVPLGVPEELPEPGVAVASG